MVNDMADSDGNLDIVIERVDDIPLLIAMMQKTGLVQVLDNHIPIHWKQR
jgi:hypothetical protein